ncbi:glycine oxidase ThiO [Imhoffiella purpurea]|uniref:Glycine oxidase ThiO n=1 Tax=Imhoffiella purpurea TaxID=1249627 RepID=W9VTD8_9GAMM|nr:glycine oxidase ThiO [Imhoffiella purpurea]EXJ13650.1 Glycine oxidase ThiO [Imhoffiella purpurea]
MTDVLVIGGGIIGLLTAREIADAGASVTLVEMGQTGRESSWAGGGIVSPLYPWRYADSVSELVRWSQRAYPNLTTSLYDETGIDPEYSVNGMLMLDMPAAELSTAQRWAERLDVEVQTIEGAILHEREPQLEPTRDPALLLPDVAQIRPPRLAKAVRRSLERRIALREREEVLELLIENGRAVGVRTPRGDIPAHRIVICAGAWTAKLLEQLGTAPEIRPVRGQMLLFYGRPGQINHISLHRENYAIPRRDGRVLFGSTLEQTGFSKSTTAEAKEALYRAAVELFPILRRTPIEDHWAGLRPGSPSGIPYIGPYPGVEGLYFNAGHYRNGLVAAPASARLLANLLFEQEPIVPPEPYALDATRP